MIDPKCEGESMQQRFMRANDAARGMRLVVKLSADMARAGLLGCFDHKSGSIYLSPNVHCLGEMVFVLWHELGHAALGHAGAQPAERESDADRWAARQMFSAAEIHRIATSGESVAKLSRVFLVRERHIERVQAVCAPTTTGEALAS